MESLFTPRDVNPQIRRIIQRKARNLVGSAGYTHDDVDDITQDLLLHLLEHPFEFDPNKASLVGVVCCILDRKISNLKATQCAAKRDPNLCRKSLDDPVQDTYTELSFRRDFYDCDTYLQRTGKASRPQEDLLDLHIDVHQLLDELPDPHRRVAELLMSATKSDAARTLDLPRSTLEDICKKLKERLQGVNLDDYL